MKHNGGVQPVRESLKTRILRALPSEHRRGVALGALVGALVLVAGGVAIAATVDNSAPSEVAGGTQPEIVNAPSALPSTGPNDPLVANPQSPTPSTLLPGGGSPAVTQRPVSPTTANNGSTTTTTAPGNRGGSNSNPGISPTTTTAPRVTPTSAPAATQAPTGSSPTTTLIRFDRIFNIAALDGSNAFLPGDPRVAIDVDTNDNGGFISKISVNWQAGLTPETRVYDLADCSVGTNGRPTSNRSERFSYNYADAGTYNVVVAVTSTDCNGENSRTNYQMVSLTASGIVAQGDQQARR